MKEKSAEHPHIPAVERDGAQPLLVGSSGVRAMGEGLGSGRSEGLWNRNFRLFFVARTAALFGDGMIPVALTAGLLGAGRPHSSVGFALAAWMGPLAVFVLFGGVLADRFTPAG